MRERRTCEGCGQELSPADFFNEDGSIEIREVCFNIDCDYNNP